MHISGAKLQHEKDYHMLDGITKKKGKEKKLIKDPAVTRSWTN